MQPMRCKATWVQSMQQATARQSCALLQTIYLFANEMLRGKATRHLAFFASHLDIDIGRALMPRAAGGAGAPSTPWQ